MTLLKTIAFVVLGLSLQSCKKNGGTSKNNWRIPMVKTAEINGLTYTYEYDREGRMVKTEDGAVRTEVSYSSDSIFFKSTEIATNVVQRYSGKLNATGRILSINGTEYKYDASDRHTETLFAPDNNGWQKWNRYYYNTTTGLLDSMRQSETRLLQNRWLQTIIYTYYTDLAETHGNENFGMGYWGKNDPHPVKHSETWSPISMAPFRKITYTTNKTYGYDDAGRIAVEDHAETRPDNTSVQWRTVYRYY